MTRGCSRDRPRTAIAATIALALTLGTNAFAQGRTDVVTLANGDRITGEIVRLERGMLEFKTDDAGTLYLEWDKLVSLEAMRVVEVMTSDGLLFLGTLGPADDRSIAIVSTVGGMALQMADVTFITPIGASFWSKLDGAFDVGFSYTQSSGIAQLNLNSSTVYRRSAFQAGVAASLTGTKTDDDDDRNDRGSLDLSYLRYPWQRLFFGAAARFETNESLGLVLRSQIGAAVGPRLVNSNRAQLVLGAGLAVNDERGVDVDPTQNIEGLLLFRLSYYTYDRPKTNIDISTQYYPSLNSIGRQRAQLDAGIRRELLKDFFISLNVYNTYDSDPPNPEADTNDVGVVTSIGWSY
jgi:hypothetical protein